jgi:twinfilin-like protein
MGDTERLVPKETTPRHGTEAEDFDAIPPLLENTKDAPAYILVKLDSDSNNEQEVQWCLCTYVPDHANVRNKMLYSSTKATLARQLGEGKFKYNIHASTLVSKLCWTCYYALISRPSSIRNAGSRSRHCIAVTCFL